MNSRGLFVGKIREKIGKGRKVFVGGRMKVKKGGGGKFILLQRC